MIPNLSDTICAIATPSGVGAIAIIRISGKSSHEIIKNIFTPSKKGSKYPEMWRLYYGEIFEKENFIDDVLVAYFPASASYTGEESVEISCHGSLFIQNKIIELIISKGARMAEAGEFTLRSFVNGKMDLIKAEAVDDVIQSRTSVAHNLAVKQMRGNYQYKIKELRQQLIDLKALLELEIDFSEEDVEFADRTLLRNLCQNLLDEINLLTESFKTGNNIKDGIPVVIAGEPNVGKSTLLNAILCEERAIVSNIPGTTRDYIEDTIIINNVLFRFIDTAGLRNTSDPIEAAGVERSIALTSNAAIVLLLFDASNCNSKLINDNIEQLKTKIPDIDFNKVLIIVNKTDLNPNINKYLAIPNNIKTVFISTKNKENIEFLLNELLDLTNLSDYNQNIILSNVRHYNEFMIIKELMEETISHIDTNHSQDIISSFLHKALHHIGLITGEVSNEDVLYSIFSKFCIGK